MPKENIFCNVKENMSTKFTRYQENELIILPLYYQKSQILGRVYLLTCFLINQLVNKQGIEKRILDFTTLSFSIIVMKKVLIRF